MGETILLERHVLASPATAYDTAWSTYGVTPGARSRTGRLEEEVPWGTHVARAADPARLSGPAEGVLAPSNFDRLGQAVLPLEGWLGFSLWGAFGHGPTAARGDGKGARRVLTHTLLLTADAFRRIGGCPTGLLRTGGRPASWLRRLAESSDFLEPTALDPARVAVDPASLDALARGRLEEVARLRRMALASVDGDTDRLRGRLSALYEALARTRPGGGMRHVVVRGVGASTSVLLRLVWLSLPLEDRLEVSFVTEQRRTERPRARLLGLPEAEWGRYVPDGSWVLDEHDPIEPAPGREHWAELVAAPGFPDGFDRLDAQARRRGWRLVGAGDLDGEAGRARWRRRWRAEGPTLAAVRELWRVESGRPGGARSRAVGVALGRAVAEEPSAAGRERRLDDVLGLLGELPPGARVAVLRGTVRELVRRGAEGRLRGALLRCRSVADERVPADELHRLVDRESAALRTLLAEASGGGGLDLVTGALALAGRGDPVGRELVRLGVAETRWTPERARVLAAALADRDPGGPVLADIVEALVREADAAGVVLTALPPARLARPEVLAALLDVLDAGRDPFGAARSDERSALADGLARTLLTRAGPAGLGGERAEAVLRLLWTAGSDRALDALHGRPAVEAGVLAELLVRPAPVPLFHRIRRRLDEAAEVAPGEPRLASYAPALVARRRPEDGRARVLLAVGR